MRQKRSLYQQALAEVTQRNPEAAPEELAEWAHDLVMQWRQQAADEELAYGAPLDSPCLEPGVANCDDWGTGEGRYHGRI